MLIEGIVRFVLNFKVEIKLQIFFDRPQHLSNLMTSFRTMDILGFRNCVINDQYNLLDKPWTKDLMRKMRSYSAGAVQYIEYEFTHEPDIFLQDYPGRKIVAVAPNPGVVSIDEFEFRDNDMVIFGAEADGLTSGFERYCDVQVTIPAVGVTNSMNVSVAAGIVLYLARKSLNN